MAENKKKNQSGVAFSYGGYDNFVTEYHNNPDFRHELQVNPTSVAADWGFPVQEDGDVRIAVNTQETFHLVIPEDPNNELSDEALQAVSGGIDLYMSSISTIASCASSVSSESPN